jgi:hypothetical protein
MFAPWPAPDSTLCLQLGHPAWTSDHAAPNTYTSDVLVASLLPASLGSQVEIPAPNKDNGMGEDEEQHDVNDLDGPDELNDLGLNYNDDGLCDVRVSLPPATSSGDPVVDGASGAPDKFLSGGKPTGDTAIALTSACSLIASTHADVTCKSDASTPNLG